MSKNYGVAPTLWSFGSGLNSLNCLLIFSLVMSSWVESSLRRFKELLSSRKFRFLSLFDIFARIDVFFGLPEDP